MPHSFPPHFVRVARSLAFVSASLAVPACGAVADPPSAETNAAAVPTALTGETRAPSSSAPAPISHTPLTELPGFHESTASDIVTREEPSGAVATTADAGSIATSPSPRAGTDAGAPPRPHTSGPLGPPELPIGMV